LRIIFVSFIFSSFCLRARRKNKSSKRIKPEPNYLSDGKIESYDETFYEPLKNEKSLRHTGRSKSSFLSGTKKNPPSIFE